MDIFGSVYRDRRTFVTGHTGFKGSWLCRWLELLGANVRGYALAPPTEPNHFDLIGLKSSSTIGDIRDYVHLLGHIEQCQPEIVFHLAAQASVLYSYDNPVETFGSNVMGTVNVLEACRHTPSVRAVIVVTTDKCYDNKEWVWGYRENDRIGGSDPYSASKSCAELVTASYRRSFCSLKDNRRSQYMLVGSARAGNVIGGGDWTADRLIPDAMRAVANGETVRIRNPDSLRPWQHVLEPLAGYLLLGEKLLEGRAEFAEAWNFGPEAKSNLSVSEIVEAMRRYWPAVSGEYAELENKPHEASLLMLDSTKARRQLDWRPVWGIETTLERTADWYRGYLEDGLVTTDRQITEYVAEATKQGVVWT